MVNTNNTPQITTNISSDAKFNFSKDDILLIATEAKESELLPQVEDLQNKIKEIQEESNSADNSLKETILKILEENLDNTDFKLKDNVQYSSYINIVSNTDTLYSYPHFDINRAEVSKNPKLAFTRNKLTRTLKKWEFMNNGFLTVGLSSTVEVFGVKKKVEVSANIYTDKGTELPPRENKRIHKLIKEFVEFKNKANLELIKLEEQLNLVEKELILLDTDKTIKANLYKKILSQNPELQKLIS